MSRLYVYEGKIRTTYYTITPGNKRLNLGHDLNEAKQALLALQRGESAGGTVGALLDKLIIERRQKVSVGRLAAGTLESNLLEVEQLKLAFGEMPPKAVKPKHIWAYLHLYRGKESPIRANREIALLSIMFNKCLGAGIVDINPCVGVERNEEIARDRLVSDDELNRFVHFCYRRSEGGKRVALALMISYLTGKAQGQVLRLHVSQLGAEGIEFGKRKRGAATLVEWSPRLQGYVRLAMAQPSTITSQYVIHTRTGSPYGSDGFKSLWQRLMREWVEQGNERFTFHDLRAKAVTDVSDQGRKASELTGHRTEAVVAKVYDRRRVRRSAPVK